MKCFVGTYQPDGRGIYSFQINEDTGILTSESLFSEVKNSKYLAYYDKYIFSIIEENDKSGICVINNEGEIIDKLLCESICPCYIKYYKNFIYTANYHLGTINKFKFENNKLELVSNYTIAPKAGSHQIIIDGDRLFVPCLLLDNILVFDLELNFQDKIKFPESSGPRHGVISKENNSLFIITELSNKIYQVNLTTYDVKDCNMLLASDDSSNTFSAALKMNLNSNYLYTSTRGEDIISIIEISDDKLLFSSKFSTEGFEPRDILAVCSNKYLLVANKNSNEVVSFSLEDNSLISKVTIPGCACLICEKMEEV
ncbi:MAG: beta-propeller fold lactonase family protein [bacterium]